MLKHLLYLQLKLIQNKMRKLVFVALATIAIMACSKEEVKEIILDRVEGSASLKATINGTEVAFPATTYSDVNMPKSVLISAAAINGTVINVSSFVNYKGELINESDEATFTHGPSATDLNNTLNGNIQITAWDTVAEKISGTFDFKYFNGTDSVFITNGIFTDLGK
jgi:hypothetical protein